MAEITSQEFEETYLRTETDEAGVKEITKNLLDNQLENVITAFLFFGLVTSPNVAIGAALRAGFVVGIHWSQRQSLEKMFEENGETK